MDRQQWFGWFIEAAQKESGEYVYRGPLVKWKDKKKIGLGSSLKSTA